MEVPRKQNEELNARITAAEARSSEKERERAERREKERRDRIHRGKRPVNPRQEDNESTVQGENEENRDKSRRTNEGSRRDRTHREESPRQESRREESKRSHRSRRHREKPQHEGTQGTLQSHQEAKMKDLEDKYTRMLRRMDGEDPGLMAWDMLEDESLPFTRRVKAYPMPDKFKMPRIEKYDGNGDPQEHLEAFREHIVLHGTPDEIACRAFPLTLKGVAKDWFTGLPPKSVGTFKDLGRLFLTQFLATRKRKKDPICLLTLHQDKEESLKDFMLRFNREKLEVDTPDDKTLLCALMQGVRAEGALMAEVGRKNVKKVTLPQFMKLTEEFIHQEELVGALLKAQTLEEQAKKEKKRDSNPLKVKEDKNPRRGEKKPSSLFKNESRKTEPSRFPREVFTPLNASLTEVLSAIRGDPTFRWPQKMKTDPFKRDRSKFCEYHADHGHSTEDCISLRREIEVFIQNGKLVRFLVAERNREANRRGPPEGIREGLERAEPRRRDEAPREARRDQERREIREEPLPNQEVVREIHTIAGGIAGGGDSNSARKAHARSLQGQEVYSLHRPSKLPRTDSVALSFSEEDARGVVMPHDDALVVTLTVANHGIHRILVDNGSSADILYWPAFQQMGIDRERIKPFTSPLVGFGGEVVFPIGIIPLPVTAGTAPQLATVMVDFLVIDRPSAYNAIMGRPALNKLKAVTSTYHLMMKFPTEEGVGVVRGDQLAARKCYNTSMKKVSDSTTLTVASVHEAKGEPAEPLEEVSIGDGRTLQIGTCLEIGVREDLVKFLHNNTEVFAWSHEDMPGINPEEIVHVLNVNPDAKPVKQKRRKFAPERVEAITVEVEKLLKAQFIEEVHYPEWLANVVLVKKSNGKWRMCVDFTDLNKACPKDSFPLPRIDALVDSTSGYGLLSFMDAFSGYNQILMHPQDREKTAFITDRGLYCYKVMPFGLKNAGATYQRLVNKMFQAQIGRNMEVYVDDMLVKSKESRDHIRDLHEAFATLKQYGMKLNPSKCAFGVSSGKFLGYMVSSRGIEANPEKIRAVLEMQSPKTTKQLQQLTGRLAALNRFISRSTDKCLPFFKILRKAFEWSDECEEAFSNLKAYLTSPPLLSRTIPGEVLYLYLAVTPTAISAALIREDEGIQKPVYFVSKALHGAEGRYPQIEKLAFALVMASRKLRPYFQAHTIRVLTEYPLRKVMQKLDLSGRLANWAIELGQFDLEFIPRNAIKGQALADFLVEFTNVPEIEQPDMERKWVIYVDGSSTKKKGGAGIVLFTPDGEELSSSLTMEFKTTNNEAEYEAVVAGLELALELGADSVEVRSDSQVIVGHINGEFEAKGEKMKKYLTKVQSMQAAFRKFCIKKIPREDNEKADHLARRASAEEEESGENDRVIPTLRHPSIFEEASKALQVSPIEEASDWRQEIFSYLQDGILPSDKKSAIRLKMKAGRFTILNGLLYKRGFTLPLLKCISTEEGNYVLREIHEGICGSHSGARVLAHKAVRAGFYWPNMHKDSTGIVRYCDKCQRFANITKQPPEELTAVSSPWPFSQWGVDIVGPLPRGKGGVRFAVVAVDYFTKWTEVEPLVNITTTAIQRFLWKNVVCRYGVPHAFVTDNGKQFDCEPFRKWCAELRIRNYFSSPGHPQANGQVEATNKTIFKILKKKLSDKKGNWADDLPEVLWAYRTTKRTPTEESPYALTFGTEAVIPAELGSGSLRVESYQREANAEGLKLHLDLLQERRDQAQITLTAYQERMAKYFNRKVKPRSFKVGDLVLRKVTLATRDPVEGKLAPNWEGPYKVIECRRPGAYYLEDLMGKALPRPWNADHLKKYFI
jgi:ribonuclease HI